MKKMAFALSAMFITVAALADIPPRVFYGKYQSTRGTTLYIGKGAEASDLKLQWYKNGDKKVEEINRIGKKPLVSNVPGDPSRFSSVTSYATIGQEEEFYIVTSHKDYVIKHRNGDDNGEYFEHLELSLTMDGELTVTEASGDGESDPHETITQLKRRR